MKKDGSKSPLKGILLTVFLAAGLAAAYLFLREKPERSAEPPSPAPIVEAAVTPAPSEPPAPVIESTDVYITELMASNKTFLLDGYGTFSDWIELTNTGPSDFDVTGWWLSDDESEPCKWQLPSLVLAPGERRIIFCSGKDSTAKELHASFSLSSAGETVILSGPTGNILDTVSFENAGEDQSVCFDSGHAVYTYTPTPGYPNTDDGYEQYISSSDVHGALVVNEAVLYNLNYSVQDGEYYDWIELKNVSASPVKLSDYFISDDEEDLKKFRLPDTTLEAGGLYMIFCSGDEALSDNAHVHAPFGLSSKGDAVYITGADGSVSDHAAIRGTTYGGSYGRADGKAGFFYYTVPSPAEENPSDGFRQVSAMPTVSVEQGVYNDIDSLDVALDGNGTIYYTLDSTEPTVSAAVYSSPLRITENTVIRAMCVEEGKAASHTATFSYIIHQNDTLPVASLVCPEENFRAVWTSGFSDLSTDAVVSFFEDGGSFTSGCSIKLHGASSRTAWSKKSLKLTFKSRYGGDLAYDIFGDGRVTSFHSVLLRGGSESGLQILRDEFAAKLASAITPEGEDMFALNARYCVLYVNGEYYGIYAFREAYSEEYVASHTGSDPDNVVIARAPARRGEMHEILSYILNHDMKDAENYAYISSRLDMRSLAMWASLESYFNNRDIDGNIRYIKGDVPDSKWRLAFFDLDFSLLDSNAGWYTTFTNTYQLGQVLLRLKSNEQFRTELLTVASELYKNGLDEETTRSIFDEIMLALDEDTVSRSCQRWGDQLVYWDIYSSQMRSNVAHARTVNWIDSLGVLLGVDHDLLVRYFGDYK